jgi:LacI family transcriptional regulator
MFFFSSAIQISAQRFAGYQAALGEAGIAVEKSLIAQGFFTYRSGLKAAEQLLSVAKPPTAVFASNDDMAAATVAIAHRHHLDVPKDLTVCGFDDTEFSRSIWPEITTIHQPIADMSRAAVQLLGAKNQGPARRQGRGLQTGPAGFYVGAP